MTEPPARVTAVIVAYGSPVHRLDRAVSSVLASVATDVRVVVVDNASPDGGAAAREVGLRHPEVQVVEASANRGFAAGVNLGLDRRRPGDDVLVLNDDAWVEPELVTRCRAALAAGGDDCVAVAPLVLVATSATSDAGAPDDAPPLVDSLGVVMRPNGEAFNALIGQPWIGQSVDGEEVLGPCFAVAYLAAASLRPDVVGRLDERYHLYYEDVDWALCARLGGHRCVAATGAVAHHEHAASTRTLGEGRRFQLVQRNLLLATTLHLSWRSVARIWGNRLATHAKGVIRGPYRMERVRAVAGALVRLPGVLVARRATPRRGAVHDESLLAFAEGLEPYFTTDGYRPDRPDEALAAARARREQRRS